MDNEYFSYIRKVSLISKAPYKIAISRRFGNKKLEVPPEGYSKVRADYARIVDSDQEQIVLKKQYN